MNNLQMMQVIARTVGYQTDIQVDAVVGEVMQLGASFPPNAIVPYEPSSDTPTPVANTYDSRGFSLKRTRGMVRIKGIDALKARSVTDERPNAKELGKLIPYLHLTDDWNKEAKAISLEGINTLDIPEADRFLLNLNMNRWYFRDLDEPTIPSFRYYRTGMGSYFAGGWNSGRPNTVAPYCPAFGVRSTNNPRMPFILNLEDEIEGAYVWPANIDTSSSEHHVKFWETWYEEMLA